MNADSQTQRVSVIVLNYNGAASLRDCVESIRSQSYSLKEIVLVDNNSTDGSMYNIEEIFPDLRVIRSSRNLGFAEGNNLGIRNSTGELVLMVNNDVILERDVIKHLVESLHDRVGIVGGLLYYHRGGKIWAYGGRFDPLTGMHWQLLQGVEQSLALPEKTEVDYVPGALLLIRRAILERAGLLDRYFFLYGDDIDLALKVRRLGFSVVVTSLAKATHMVSQGVRNLEQRHERIGYFLMNRNMFYLYFVQLPLPFALTSTMSQVAFLYFETVLFRRPLSYTKTKINALGQALKDVRIAWTTRKKVNRLGEIPFGPSTLDFLKIGRDRVSNRRYYW